MKDYIVMLIGASLISGVLFMLSPKGHQKYLRLLCGLCTVALLVAPLPSYLEGLALSLPSPDGEETETAYEDIFRQALCESNVAQMETAIKAVLLREFALADETVDVTLLWERSDEKMVLKKAILSLSGKAILEDPRPLCSRVEDLLKCPCEVVYI